MGIEKRVLLLIVLAAFAVQGRTHSMIQYAVTELRFTTERGDSVLLRADGERLDRIELCLAGTGFRVPVEALGAVESPFLLDAKLLEDEIEGEGRVWQLRMSAGSFDGNADIELQFEFREGSAEVIWRVDHPGSHASEMPYVQHFRAEVLPCEQLGARAGAGTLGRETT